MNELEINQLHQIIKVIERTGKNTEQTQRDIKYIKNIINRKEKINHSIKKCSDPNYLPSYNEAEFILNNTNHEQWFNFINQQDSIIYEFLNQDYIDALASYIKKGKNNSKEYKILEAGAGNGRLTHFLRKKLKEINLNEFDLIATDSGSWNINPNFPVETICINDALNKYNPDMVIFSWMPYQEDFTQIIRDCASVNEYILIGETDFGCCGDMWLTWGIQSYEDEINSKKIKPYIKDGFIRKDLSELVQHQICRTDKGRGKQSRTVSFKRI